MEQGRTFDQEANLPQELYRSDWYFSKELLYTLVSQITVVHAQKPKSILEIGHGNGFVSSYLKAMGYNVTTFDINQNLNPDLVGNIIDIEQYFSQDSFDLILCAEVLEHLPFNLFREILAKLSHITNKSLVLTLPRRHRILLDFTCRIKSPFGNYKHFEVFWSLPGRLKLEEHHWEIDYKKEFSLKNVSNAISENFEILRTFSESNFRYHQFFILRKR